MCGFRLLNRHDDVTFYSLEGSLTKSAGYPACEPGIKEFNLAPWYKKMIVLETTGAVAMFKGDEIAGAAGVWWRIEFELRLISCLPIIHYNPLFSATPEMIIDPCGLKKCPGSLSTGSGPP